MGGSRWNEWAQFQPSLRRGNRPYPSPRNRATASRSGAAIVIGLWPAREADLAALRLRFGGNDAPQLPAAAGSNSTGISLSVQGVKCSFDQSWILLPPLRRNALDGSGKRFVFSVVDR